MNGKKFTDTAKGYEIDCLIKEKIIMIIVKQ